MEDNFNSEKENLIKSIKSLNSTILSLNKTLKSVDDKSSIRNNSTNVNFKRNKGRKDPEASALDSLNKRMDKFEDLSEGLNDNIESFDKTVDDLGSNVKNISDEVENLSKLTDKLTDAVKASAIASYNVAKVYAPFAAQLAGGMGLAGAGLVLDPIRIGGKLITKPFKLSSKMLMRAGGMASAPFTAGARRYGSIGKEMYGETKESFKNQLFMGMAGGPVQAMLVGTLLDVMGVGKPRQQKYKEPKMKRGSIFGKGVRKTGSAARGLGGQAFGDINSTLRYGFDSLSGQMASLTDSLTSGKMKTRGGSFKNVSSVGEKLDDQQIEEQAKTIAKALKEYMSDTKGVLGGALSTLFNPRAILGYAIPAYGIGYKMELPNLKRGVLLAMAKTLGMIYVHNRFASKELNDLMTQQMRILQAGLGVEGEIVGPKSRSISEYLGRKIGKSVRKRLGIKSADDATFTKKQNFDNGGIVQREPGVPPGQPVNVEAHPGETIAPTHKGGIFSRMLGFFTGGNIFKKLIGAFDLIRKKLDEMTTSIKERWDHLTKSIVETIDASIKNEMGPDFVGPIRGFASMSFGEKLHSIVKTIPEMISQTIIDKWDKLGKYLDRQLEPTSAKLSDKVAKIYQTLIPNVIKSILFGKDDDDHGVMSPISGAIKGAFRAVMTIGEAFTILGKSFRDYIFKVVEPIKKAIQDTEKLDLSTKIYSIIKSLPQALAGVVTNLKILFEGLKETFLGLFSGIKDIAGSMSDIKSIKHIRITMQKQIVEDLTHKILSKNMSSIVKKIQEYMIRISEMQTDIFWGAITGIMGKAEDGKKSAKDVFTEAKKKAGGGFSGLTKGILASITHVVSSTVQPIKDFFIDIKATLKDLKSSIVEEFFLDKEDGGKKFSFRKLTKFIWDELAETLVNLKNTLVTIGENLKETFKYLKNKRPGTTNVNTMVTGHENETVVDTPKQSFATGGASGKKIFIPTQKNNFETMFVVPITSRLDTSIEVLKQILEAVKHSSLITAFKGKVRGIEQSASTLGKYIAKGIMSVDITKFEYGKFISNRYEELKKIIGIGYEDLKKIISFTANKTIDALSELKKATIFVGKHIGNIFSNIKKAIFAPLKAIKDLIISPLKWLSGVFEDFKSKFKGRIRKLFGLEPVGGTPENPLYAKWPTKIITLLSRIDGSVKSISKNIAKDIREKYRTDRNETFSAIESKREKNSKIGSEKAQKTGAWALIASLGVGFAGMAASSMMGGGTSNIAGAGLGAMAGSLIGAVVGTIAGLSSGGLGLALTLPLGIGLGGLIGGAIGHFSGGTMFKIFKDSPLTSSIGAGIGAIAGGVLGGLLATLTGPAAPFLMGPAIGLGAMLGGVVGAATGYSFGKIFGDSPFVGVMGGIGAIAGAVIGGLIGLGTGVLATPLGIAAGALVGGLVGSAMGYIAKGLDYLGFSTGASIGGGIGAVLGAVIGGVIAAPTGIGIPLGIGAGFLIGGAVGAAVGWTIEKIAPMLGKVAKVVLNPGGLIGAILGGIIAVPTGVGIPIGIGAGALIGGLLYKFKDVAATGIGKLLGYYKELWGKFKSASILGKVMGLMGMTIGGPAVMNIGLQVGDKLTSFGKSANKKIGNVMNEMWQRLLDLMWTPLRILQKIFDPAKLGEMLASAAEDYIPLVGGQVASLIRKTPIIGSKNTKDMPDTAPKARFHTGGVFKSKRGEGSATLKNGEIVLNNQQSNKFLSEAPETASSVPGVSSFYSLTAQQKEEQKYTKKKFFKLFEDIRDILGGSPETATRSDSSIPIAKSSGVGSSFNSGGSTQKRTSLKPFDQRVTSSAPGSGHPSPSPSRSSSSSVSGVGNEGSFPGGKSSASQVKSTPSTPPVAGGGFGGGKDLSSGQPQDFMQKVNQVASDLGVDPNALLAVMKFESGINPQAVNKSTKATGLIQFMPSTARALGTTTDDLYKMSAVEQMDYVQKYFAPYKGKLKSVSDLYMSVLWPKAVGQAEDYVLWKSGTKAYDQNPLDWNKDGIITKAEAAKKVIDIYGKGGFDTASLNKTASDPASSSGATSGSMQTADVSSSKPKTSSPTETAPESPKIDSGKIADNQVAQSEAQADRMSSAVTSGMEPIASQMQEQNEKANTQMANVFNLVTNSSTSNVSNKSNKQSQQNIGMGDEFLSNDILSILTGDLS